MGVAFDIISSLLLIQALFCVYTVQ